jgi:hypothetical protein
MTPTVKFVASHAPFDSASYKWFDLTEAVSHEFSQYMQLLTLGDHTYPHPDVTATSFPMPFERIAVVDIFEPIQEVKDRLLKQGVRLKETTAVYTLERKNDELIYSVWQRELASAPAVVIIAAGSIWGDRKFSFPYELRKGFENRREERDLELSRYFFYMNRLLNVLYGSGEIKAHIPKATFTSIRQMAKGKPRAYNWSTVEIKPYRREPAPPQGGTHASPTPHERRGHVRRLKNGKVVTVRSSLVNKHKIPQQGITYHDYKGVAV